MEDKYTYLQNYLQNAPLEDLPYLDTQGAFTPMSSPTDWLPYLARNITRTGADVATSSLGSIPDVVSSLGSLAGSGINALTGHRPSEIPGAGNAISGIGNVVEGLGSEGLRNALSSLLPEGYLEPQGYGEDLLSRTAKTTGALLGPGALLSKAGQALPLAGKIVQKLSPYIGGTQESLKRAAALAGGSNIFGDIIGSIAGKGAGEFARVGSLLAFSTLGTRKNLNRLRSALYDEVRDSIPSYTETSAEDTKDAIRSVSKYLESGTGTNKDKITALNALRGVDRHISDGKAPVRQLWESKKDINKEIRELSMTAAQRDDNREVLHALGKIRDGINKSLAKFGEENPKWGKIFQEAEELTKGLNPVSKAVENINEWAPKSKSIRSLFRPDKLLVRGVSPAIGFAEKSWKQLRNPTVRGHYLQAWKDAATDKKGAFIESLSKLDKALKEEGSDEGGIFIE